MIIMKKKPSSYSDTKSSHLWMVSFWRDVVVYHVSCGWTGRGRASGGPRGRRGTASGGVSGVSGHSHCHSLTDSNHQLVGGVGQRTVGARAVLVLRLPHHPMHHLVHLSLNFHQDRQIRFITSQRILAQIAALTVRLPGKAQCLCSGRTAISSLYKCRQSMQIALSLPVATNNTDFLI